MNLSLMDLDDKVKPETSTDNPVIPKGSPLQEYLNSLCLNDEGYITNYYLKKPENYEFRSTLITTTIKSFLLCKWKWFRNQISSIFPITQSVLSEMSHDYYFKYGQEIVGSKIILDEDLDFLCLQTPQIFVDIVRKEKMEKPNKKEEPISSSILRWSTIFAVLLSLLYFNLFSLILPIYVQAVLFILFFIYIIFNARLKIAKEIWKKKLESNFSVIKNFLHLSFKYISVSRRSIRLIQELEVVNLGYRLVNGSIPAARLEQSEINRTQKRRCERLRSLLLKTTTQTYLACRQATLHFVPYLPEGVNCNKSHRAISQEVLENLHPCLTATDMLEMFVASDGFSLVSLKSLNNLLKKQISELVTHVFISLSTFTWDFSKKGLLLNIISILSEPLQVMTSSIQSLQCCLDMYKYITEVKTEASSKSFSDKKKQNKTTAFLLHLQSLQAHLRNATLMALEMHERLKEKAAADDDDNYATGILENIEHHIEVASDCLQQCSSELKYDSKKEVKCKNLEKIQSQLVVDKVDDAIKFEEEEEVDYVEDQVFEAIVDRTDAEENNNNFEDEDDFRDYSKSQEIIKELQSVLAVKTSVKEREERKCKLFPSYKSRVSKDTCDDLKTSIFTYESQKEDLKYLSNSFSRPVVRHRKPSRRSRHERLKSNPMSPFDNMPSSVELHKNDEKEEQITSCGLGIGFSQSLAAAAAEMAKNRSVQTENFVSD